MQSKITAVDYLIKEFSEILGPIQTQGMQDLFLADAIIKAKEMFQQQIEEAYYTGKRNWDKHETLSKDYYTQTFKQQ